MAPPPTQIEERLMLVESKLDQKNSENEVLQDNLRNVLLGRCFEITEDSFN